jgi:hypothetical protein
MKPLSSLTALLLVLLPTLAVAGCGDDDDEGQGLSPAQRAGVGAQCTAATQDRDCNVAEQQICLTEFKGGYCGEENCTRDADCLPGSACVAHNLGNFCFLICTDKIHCNGTRSPDNEANCVANLEFVEGGEGGVKVCVPPNSGT